MQILFVNKYLYPKGGSETHLLGLADALSGCGHTIEFFGTEHAENVTPPEQTTTVPRTDYGEISAWSEKLYALRDILFSRPAYDRMRNHLTRSRPEIAHVHNIYHQISPSVLAALHQAQVPCVMTAHDYKLVCPSYSMHDGDSACFACCGHRYWNVLVRGCSRKGRTGDLALAVEAYVHHFFRVYERYLDLIITPSRFLRDRLVEGGYAPGMIHVLPNAVNVAAYKARPKPGGYLLFVGRLSYEKGLDTLIEAARRVPDVPLWIVGDGPLRALLEQQATGLPSLRFLGRQTPQVVKSLLEDCRSLVLPSSVPENCPLSVLEAFASGKPVIATRVGGVPELFEDATGAIVSPNDPESLACAMQQFWRDSDLCHDYGVQARRRAETHHDVRVYASTLEAIYESLTATAPSAPVSAKRTAAGFSKSGIRTRQSISAEQQVRSLVS